LLLQAARSYDGGRQSALQLIAGPVKLEDAAM